MRFYICISFVFFLSVFSSSEIISFHHNVLSLTTLRAYIKYIREKTSRKKFFRITPRLMLFAVRDSNFKIEQRRV